MSTAQPGDGVAAPSITPIDPLDPAAPVDDPGTAAAPRGRTPAFLTERLGGLPRSFWVLWTGTLVNRLGTMVIPFLAFYLSGDRGLGVTQVGMVMAVGGAGSLVSQPLGGYFADRFGRRVTLCGGMIASGVVMVVLGYAATLPLLVAAVFLNGVTVDLYRPASSALVADMVPSAQRPRAFGLLFWAINLGFAFATTLGGMLARHGYGLLFWIDALTCAAFAALIWRLVSEPPRARTDGSGSAGGWREVLRDRVMVAYVVISLGYVLVYQQAYTTLPLAMSHDHLSASAYGTAIALNGAVIVIVQPLMLPWLTRRDRSHVVAAGMVVVGTGFGLNAVASTALMYATNVVVWTFGEIITVSVVMAIVADLAPDHLRGRYQGLWGMAWSVAALVAPLGGAPLLAHGKLLLWPVCAGLAIAAAVGQLLLAPAIRRRTRT